MNDGFRLDEIHSDWLILSERGGPTASVLARIEEEMARDAEQIKFNNRLKRVAHLCIRLHKSKKRPVAVYLRKIRRVTNLHVLFLVRQIIASENLRRSKLTRRHYLRRPLTVHA